MGRDKNKITKDNDKIIIDDKKKDNNKKSNSKDYNNKKYQINRRQET